MSNTLTVGSTTLTLPDDLAWGDEFDWHPVRQSVEPTITGALIVQSGVLQAGRPLTLRSSDGQSAWVPRTSVAQLQIWAAQPGLEMTLTLRGVLRTVLWRHDEPPALTAEPVVDFSDPADEDPYLVILKLMQIA